MYSQLAVLYKNNQKKYVVICLKNSIITYQDVVYS